MTAKHPDSQIIFIVFIKKKRFCVPCINLEKNTELGTLKW